MFKSFKLSVWSLVFGLVICCLSAEVLAQRPGSGRPGFGQGDLTRLLFREDVRRELELTEEQADELRSMGNPWEGMREKFREMRNEGLSRDEMRERLAELRVEREAEVKENVSEVLLPFQFKRLQQISNQAVLNQNGQAMLSGAIAEQLEITDNQKDKIRAKAEQLRKELDEKVAKLREEMRENLLKELTPEQQKKFKAMIGETFKFEQGDERQRGRRRNNRRPGREADGI